MTVATKQVTKLSAIASFAEHSFLENLAVRSDSSLIVTVANRRELWYIPPVSNDEPLTPILIDTPVEATTGIVEIEPDVFCVSTSRNLNKSDGSYLLRFDLRKWRPGASISPEVVYDFGHSVLELNGSCLVTPNVMLLADCFSSTIWRVDLFSGREQAKARIWLKHKSMDHDPAGPTPDKPGVNGLRFSTKTDYLYYTSTTQELFMRLRVDPLTHNPVGEPELFAAGMMGDDFCLDEDSGAAYITTHRQNTIDRVWLTPSRNEGVRQSVAGDPLNELLIGPSSGAWERGPGEYGRVAFFTSDGGTKSPPPDGVVRTAKVLRVEF